MACACHGKRGVAVKHAGPYDQCTTCALKHIIKAWTLFNEFTYTEDNRNVITGQIRNAMDHLKDDHRETALLVRDLAVLIESHKDWEAYPLWPEVLDKIQAHYNEDHKENEELDKQLKIMEPDGPVDLIIPLGTGSITNNDELKLFLRSIERNVYGLRNIIVVTPKVPAWLNNVAVISVDDPLPHNKDGNIINKVLTAAGTRNISKNFVWSADDCVVLKPVDFSTLPPIYNVRTKDKFNPQGSIWHKRIYRTFEFLEQRGVNLKHNYESHTPQRFPTQMLLNAMKGVDYKSDIGYTIDTLFFGLIGITEGVEQTTMKVTAERPGEVELNKTFLGYNDAGFVSGLRDRLFKIFDQPSKYEK